MSYYNLYQNSISLRQDHVGLGGLIFQIDQPISMIETRYNQISNCADSILKMLSNWNVDWENDRFKRKIEMMGVKGRLRGSKI